MWGWLGYRHLDGQFRLLQFTEQLRAAMIEAVCFDLGDTLVAEETVIHDSSGQAITVDATESAFKVLEAIRKDGCRIALMANADSTGARNIVKATGLEDYFDAIIISGGGRY